MNDLKHSRTLSPRFFGAAILLALAGIAGNALAAVRYVDVNSANPTQPYTNWTTAATNIQDAVDTAVAGDEIMVTNGIYAMGGGRATVGDSTTNRVAVDKPLTLRSVNGPQSTTIDGGQSGRCVYLTSGASLSGFTLTNGLAVQGAGLWCQSTNAVASNCVVSGNSAPFWSDRVLEESSYGAGAYGGTLYNCTLSGNSAGLGGGAFGGTLNNCTLTGNSAANGGGAGGCALNNCALTGNSGGGASSSTLNNCTLTGNVGGAYSSMLNNCIVYFNTALQAANYDSSCTLSYCCTTPQPTTGAGNISLDPQLASSSHLSVVSPCRGAGNAAYASGTDIDGEPWANPPSIGCDEHHAGVLTGPLSVSIGASFTYVPMGFTVQFMALLEGRTTANFWDFGDGTVGTNQPYTSHAWTALGDYAVVLRAFNESQPGGISATVTVHVVVQPVHYVAASSTNPVAPYASWATAATNIQDAVDAAVPGALLLVTNGNYATGWRNGNRVAVDKPLTLRSINGPQFTTIDGSNAARCVYLTDGASLSGFTLTNGSAHSGGGLWCQSTNAVVSNCVVSGNATFGQVICGFDCFVSAAFAGGVYGGTLNDCILSDNRAEAYYDPFFQGRSGLGGGAGNATLTRCTLTGNSAGHAAGAYGCTLNNCTLTANSGGGADASTLNNCTLTGNSSGANSSTLNNCIVYFNTAQEGVNYDFSCTLSYCCTTPLPTNGVGNITKDPAFVNLAAGNYRLRSDSACIDAGTNLSASITNDLDGRPRPLDGNGDGVAAFDIGAYEYRTPLLVWQDSPSPASPYSSWATAATNIQDAVDVAVAGDEIVVTNGIYVTGGRGANRVTVDKALNLRSVNGPQVTTIDGDQLVRCVYLTNGASLSGFTLTNGNTFEFSGGAGVLCGSQTAVVSNCVVSGNLADADLNHTHGGGASGATLNNCTLSGNAAEFGGGASGCNLNNCMLNGNGADYGGGVEDCTLNLCILIGNDASPSGDYTAHFYFDGGYGGGAAGCTLNNCTLNGNFAYGGGGASGSTLNNCTLTGNSASNIFWNNSTGGDGGGALGCALNNCTLAGNSASGGSRTGGGAAEGCILNNCIAYFNTAAQGENYDSSCTLNYSCATPQPTNGVGNISSEPLFLNTNGWADLRLQSNSPCINAGNNSYVTNGTDLAGDPRIAGATVDIGAYEFQSPASLISYAWLQRYGLPIDGSADTVDPDGDGLNNWQEWRCGTDPTNALSSLRLLAPVGGSTNVTVSWQSVTGVSYFLERSTGLATSAAFASLATNIPGQPGTTIYTDTNAIGAGPWFYRVGVSTP